MCALTRFEAGARKVSRTRIDSFGGRACRAIRERLLKHGVASLPKGWQRAWIVQRILATPPWADMAEIREVYREAAAKTRLTGEQHVVDHIVPLNHPRVCGLHVAWNLEAVPYARNARKSNYWCPEQSDLFEHPNQPSLL